MIRKTRLPLQFVTMETQNNAIAYWFASCSGVEMDATQTFSQPTNQFHTEGLQLSININYMPLHASQSWPECALKMARVCVGVCTRQCCRQALMFLMACGSGRRESIAAAFWENDDYVVLWYESLYNQTYAANTLPRPMKNQVCGKTPGAGFWFQVDSFYKYNNAKVYSCTMFYLSLFLTSTVILTLLEFNFEVQWQN